jgi:hypothetical protein
MEAAAFDGDRLDIVHAPCVLRTEFLQRGANALGID